LARIIEAIAIPRKTSRDFKRIRRERGRGGEWGRGRVRVRELLNSQYLIEAKTGFFTIIYRDNFELNENPIYLGLMHSKMTANN
jgi:hypothetical protein